MSIYEPYHHLRNLKPLQERFTHDPHSPSEDAHSDHVSDVMHESENKGFPVAPAPRKWP